MNTIKKIVALGDSITKGVIYDGESYQILSESFVSQCAENMNVDVDTLTQERYERFRKLGNNV